jgi:hypothetical protein
MRAAVRGRGRVAGRGRELRESQNRAERWAAERWGRQSGRSFRGAVGVKRGKRRRESGNHNVSAAQHLQSPFARPVCSEQRDGWSRSAAWASNESAAFACQAQRGVAVGSLQRRDGEGEGGRSTQERGEGREEGRWQTAACRPFVWQVQAGSERGAVQARLQSSFIILPLVCPLSLRMCRKLCPLQLSRV